jgi:hypothetical protein
MYFVILSAQLVDGYGSFKVIVVVVVVRQNGFGAIT